MKKIKSYKGDTTFITVFENGYHLINNGYYIVRADKGTTVETDSSKNENVLININSDYFLFEMRFIGINAGPMFKFNESVSFMIPCKNQQEIDYYWDALTANGGVESVCGWLKDKYGLSWQVCPENWEELNKKPGAFKKMMGMKKLIIADF